MITHILSRGGASRNFSWSGEAAIGLGAVPQATSLRGWTLPKLEEVHVMSKTLESSGFTTVHSPKLRASSQSALSQVQTQQALAVIV